MAIMMVLLSLLLPALSRAKAQARFAGCISNQRKIGLGLVMYADANDDVCVPGRPAKIGATSDPRNLYDVGNGLQYRPRWFVTLGGQAGVYAFNKPSADPADDNSKQVDNRVFICPETGWSNNRNFSYGYNFQFIGNTRVKANGEYINYPVRYSAIQAAGTVLFADSLGTAAGKPTASRTKYRPDGSADVFAVGNHGWALDPPRLTRSSDFCDDANRTPENRGGVDGRHSGRASVSFADGHAERATPAQLGYRVAADGHFAMDGDNRLFSGTGEDMDPPSLN